MMKYADIKKNDVVDCESGICVSFWVQGCPHHCQECHNPDQWDYNGGKEFTSEVMDELLTAIPQNGIQRNFSILGGEPLCEENKDLTALVARTVREKFPNILIYIWTGYLYEQVKDFEALKYADYLIDGPYIKELRDITLPLRGSSNQRIIKLR